MVELVGVLEVPAHERGECRSVVLETSEHMIRHPEVAVLPGAERGLVANGVGGADDLVSMGGGSMSLGGEQLENVGEDVIRHSAWALGE